jgi:hypothetical protein
VAAAKDGRDFAGYYALSNVRDLGATQDSSQPAAEADRAAADRAAKVRFTLTVRLSNNSDMGDIKKPVVALLESGPSHANLGKFGSVKVLPSKRDVTVSGQFTVSRAEFKSWAGRGTPKVIVLYKDETGRELRENVQLSRRPMLPNPAAQ